MALQTPQNGAEQPNVHYVVTVKVEKITVTPERVTGVIGVQAQSKVNWTRTVEEMTSLVQKGSSVSRIRQIVLSTLDNMEED